ncbi:MAG: conjugal transfer protein TraG N-terminal domain-containing protein [Sterolibacterium sp.]
MPEFTIYTFGDVEVFRAAFAAVAMIFSQDGFFTSSQGVGLGELAGLGLLIGLFVVLMTGITTGKIDLGGLLMALIVYVLMFVPQTSVNIEDYNGAAIAKVDNVPLGVAFPAGLVSGLANELNVRMGTAFSTVKGYPSGVNTPGALTSPLKALLSIRHAPNMLQANTPVLPENVANLVAYCLAGRGDNYTSWRKLKLQDDPLLYLIRSASNFSGLTYYQDLRDSDGYLQPCNVASGKIESDLQSLLDDTLRAGGESQLQIILTAAAARDGASVIELSGYNSSAQPVTLDSIGYSFQTLLDANKENAAKFVKLALFTPSVNGAFYCAADSGNPSDWAQCMPFVSATVQSQEDSAAGGSMFQRMMFHTMNALFFIWICLSPVVALLMLFLGARGLKLAGSYLLFGAWAVSWYVGASIVNFYMLKQLQYEVSMLGGVGAITPETLGHFMDIMSIKIALAGEMMSNVPLIMMAVMSGSVYGLVQVASRTGGREHYDEKVNSPTLQGSAPISQTKSQFGGGFGEPTTDQRFSQGENFETGNFDRFSKEMSVQSQTQYTQKVSNGINNALKEAYQHGDREQLMRQLGETYGVSNNEESRAAIASGKGMQYLTEKSDSFSRSNFSQESAGFGLGGESSVGGSLPGPGTPSLDENGKSRMTPGKPLVKAGGGIKASVDVNAGENIEGKSSKGTRGSIGGSKQADRSDGTSTQTKDGLDWSKVSAVGKFMEKNYGEEMSHQFGDEHAQVKSYIESGSISSSAEKTVGGKVSYEPREMLNAIRTSGADRYLAEQDAIMRTGANKEEYGRLFTDASREYGAFGDNSRPLAILKSMERLGSQFNDRDAKSASLSAIKIATGSDMSMPTVQSNTQVDSYSPDIASRAGANQVVGPNEAQARNRGHVVGNVPQSKMEAKSNTGIAVLENAGKKTVATKDNENKAAATKYDPTR